ncbi:MAG: amidohydrolase family protein [bacterium]
MSAIDRLKTIDAHVHFWDPALLHYPWHEGEPTLQRAYLPEDFAPLSNGAVDAVVFVQADCVPSKSGREVQWVERLAAREPRIIGIVAFVDMLFEQGRTPALDVLARSPLVIGVRHNIQGHDAGFALQNAFVRGVQEVGARGLTFDLCTTGEQVGEVTELVARCPGTRFVLDHCGKPAIRDDAFDTWAHQLERLAAHANVYCKLSGLLTEARPDQRNTEGVRRYAEHVMRCFGPSRMIYGSDWPVSILGGGAERWRAITDDLTASWSDDDRSAFYMQNAMQFYGLTAPARD